MPTFACGSAALSGNAKREMDLFLGDMKGPTGSGPAASERVFVVAGYTDTIGHEDYNYELGGGAPRASRESGRKEGPRPDLGSRGYGASHPVEDNNTPSGRRKNRLVEILVFQERIAS